MPGAQLLGMAMPDLVCAPKISIMPMMVEQAEQRRHGGDGAEGVGDEAVEFVADAAP